MKTYSYFALYKEDSNGQLSLYFPDIEEAYTCASSIKELKHNAKEVLILSLEVRVSEGVIPRASSYRELNLKKDEGFMFVSVTC